MDRPMWFLLFFCIADFRPERVKYGFDQVHIARQVWFLHTCGLVMCVFSSFWRGSPPKRGFPSQNLNTNKDKKLTEINTKT